MKVFRSRRVVTPEGIGPATVHVEGERIVAVADYDALPAGAERIDVGESVLMPGVVDTHVHVNEPGRTEWEGFLTATRAAASGGVTTLVDMPLNSIPPTTSADALKRKKAEATGQCLIDVGFWGGVVPGNTKDLEGLVREGARGCKAFMCFSGVDEFPGVVEADLLPAMAELKRLGRPLLVHAEVEKPVDVSARDPRSYMTYLASRPPTFEEDAVALVSRLCRETGARTHVVHHSAASALPLIRAARAAGLPFTAETCPHYLHFAAEDIHDGATAWNGGATHADSGDKQCGEDAGCREVTEIHRHRHRITASFAKRCGGNLDDPEQQRDFRHLAGGMFGRSAHNISLRLELTMANDLDNRPDTSGRSSLVEGPCSSGG